ncbi:UDP-N-acetylmuramate dehydrogenase [Psychroflexus planctonicus]|uniref:UDP-N-acetylenolpyruvoylglucosamine reductase n=1 Tax=Psychroflexus planctonicus TaxID=1526575 RepID=A0ABQ1SIA8_9FLAO|nr:UDP-N-acetylmuramate dehydrogenase [Psychroflexus planctonicus]GGE41436.1 UDP-N-acetylenolpyruvoylglucosamine reductase [Psychroflexus planctonicus]
MQIEKNASLKEFNTFGLDVKAKQYIAINSEDELKHILKRFYAEELFVLSGGSNILLTKNVEATVLHIQIKGIKVIKEQKNHVLVEAKAGENWHAFVLWCIEKNYGGLENLSLIPGYVGTSPIQNIGAYGVELKDSFVSCKAIHKQTLEEVTFTKEDCKFGYRDSIFKNAYKNQFIITSVCFELTTKKHSLKTSYGAIQAELKQHKIGNPSIKDISEAIIQIRQSKLPDPRKIGNSGSFFKNPVVDAAFFKKVYTTHPEMPFYELPDGTYKIPAGWLIESCGFKGMTKGDAGVHKKQALVLVNYGEATGEDIQNLAKAIQYKVQQVFNIQLEAEVNII